MPDLTVEQAARLLRVSRWTVSRACEDGVIPATKGAGDQWAIPVASLLAHLAAATCGGPDNLERTPMTVSELPKLYTLAEVAEQTGLGLRWLQDGCRTRTLRHVRAGRTPRMTAEHVTAAIEQHESLNHRDADVQAELDRRANRGRRTPKAA